MRNNVLTHFFILGKKLKKPLFSNLKWYSILEKWDI